LKAGRSGGLWINIYDFKVKAKMVMSYDGYEV
jgi:hypothetical protein